MKQAGNTQGEYSAFNFLSQTLFDLKKSVSRSICLKFSEKTPGAILLPQICSLVWLF